MSNFSASEKRLAKIFLSGFLTAGSALGGPVTDDHGSIPDKSSPTASQKDATTSSDVVECVKPADGRGDEDEDDTIIAAGAQPPLGSAVQPPSTSASQPPASSAPQPPGSTGDIFGPSIALEHAKDLYSDLPSSANAVGGGTIRQSTSGDTAKAIQDSGSAPTVQTQRRSQTAFDPRVRGYRYGQLLTVASGASWYAARQDLDTMLSKIDSGDIDSLVVIPGPYSVRYGPGLSFIGVETVPALQPFQNGPEFHGRTGLKYQTNGEQWNGRQSFWGGDQDWGFRVGYGNRNGSDYQSGSGDDIPSSYHSQDFDSSFGVWLTECSKIEFGYIRLDQTDTEYPGQIFDINFLVTDGYNVRYTLEHQTYFDKLVLDGWYNRTKFEGDAQRGGKRRQIPQLNSPLAFTGFTDVDELSSGYRLATSWGDKGDDVQVTFGVDLRYQEQELNEFDIFDPVLGGGAANFPIPRSHASNPGVFLDTAIVMTECWTIKAGVRADLIATNIEGETKGRSKNDLHAVLGDDFDQEFNPYAFYLTNEYKPDKHWTFSAGGGHAERPPTLTELYAVDPFLAILQQGFTQVRGNTDLHAERAWQVDVGLKADYECWRAGIQGFHSWIYDYITLESRDTTLNDNGVADGLGVNFVNTDLATLAGFEANVEYDWTDMITPFVSMSYVEGRDHRRGAHGVIPASDEEPLPGIAPFQSRVGFRYHEARKSPRWTIEFATRIVDRQDRIASSLLERQTAGFTTYDLRGYWQASDALRLTAGVENLGDAQYREHLDLRTGQGVLQPGVNFYFGFEWTY